MKSEQSNEVQNGNENSSLLSRIVTMVFKGCLVWLVVSAITIVIVVLILAKSCESESEEKATYNNPSLEKLISYIEQSGSRDDDEVEEYREAKANEKTNEDSKVVETVEEAKQTIVIDLDELGVDKETQDKVNDLLKSYI